MDTAAVEREVREETGASPRELRFVETDEGLVAFLTLPVGGTSRLADAHARASAVEERVARPCRASPTSWCTRSREALHVPPVDQPWSAGGSAASTASTSSSSPRRPAVVLHGWRVGARARRLPARPRCVCSRPSCIRRRSGSSTSSVFAFANPAAISARAAVVHRRVDDWLPLDAPATLAASSARGAARRAHGARGMARIRGWLPEGRDFALGPRAARGDARRGGRTRSR